MSMRLAFSLVRNIKESDSTNVKDDLLNVICFKLIPGLQITCFNHAQSREHF